MFNAWQKAALGESSRVTGGYIVPPDFYNALLSLAAEENTFRQRAFVQPMASATLQFPWGKFMSRRHQFGKTTAHSPRMRTDRHPRVLGERGYERMLPFHARRFSAPTVCDPGCGSRWLR
jgi:hypothetical protein